MPVNDVLPSIFISPDLKSGVQRSRGPLCHDHIMDGGHDGSVPQAIDEEFDGLAVALDQQFDPPIVQISDISLKAQTDSLALRKSAVTDALNFPFDSD